MTDAERIAELERSLAAAQAALRGARFRFYFMVENTSDDAAWYRSFAKEGLHDLDAPQEGER